MPDEPRDDAGLIERAGWLADTRPPDWIREVARFPAGPPAAAPERWQHLEILERVGRGSFGEVYRARDSRLQSEVALKLVPLNPPVAAGGPDAPGLGEARMLARVRHPNVVVVHGADAAGGYAGIWMEFVRGRTLADFVKEEGPLSAREAAEIGIALCGALAAVHGAGLLHLDVKANNVVRERGGRVVLMDFGAGHDLHGGREAGEGWQGTPAYMAPEVLRGEAPARTADIYGLAVLLFHLVTGEFPVPLPPASTLEELRAAHRERRRRLLRDARPDLPAPFAEAVERGLASDAAARPETAGAFEALLRAAARAMDAPEGGGGAPAARAGRRSPGRRVAGAALLVLLAVAGYAGLRALPDDPGTPPRVMVVPWQPDGELRDLDWWRTGLMDEMIRRLGALDGVRVVSRHTVATSLATVAGVAALPLPPLRDTAREIGADYLVSGTVGRVPGGLRVVCELTRMKDGSSRGLWEETLPEGTGFSACVASFAGKIAGALELSRRAEDAGSRGAARAQPRARPDDALREFLTGMEALEGGDYAAAADRFLRAVERDSTYAEAHFEIARITAGESERARHLGLAWKYRHAAPVATRRLIEAEWLWDREQYDDAAAAYREVLAQDPEHTLARGMLAAHYVTTRRFHEADGEYAVLHATNPLDFSFYPEWALCRRELGRWDEARARLEEWHARLPAAAGPVRQLVEQARVTGDYAAALAWCDTLDGMGEPGTAILSRWLVLVHLGRLREADASLRRLAVPDDPPASAPGRDLSYRAYVALRAERYREGLDLVNEARKRENDLYNQWLTGILAAGAGMPETAEEQVRALEKRFEQVPSAEVSGYAYSTRRFLHHLRARVALARGLPEQAVTEMRACLSHAGAMDDGFFRPDLGGALLAAKRPAEAEAEFQRVLRTNPRHPEALLGLAQALCAQGRADAAAAPLGRLREVWKEGDADDPLAARSDSLLALAGGEGPPGGH